MMAQKRAYKRTCYFCPTLTSPGDGGKYIYPLPARCKAKNNEGARACDKCTPKILEELRKEGQLMVEHKGL